MMKTKYLFLIFCTIFMAAGFMAAGCSSVTDMFEEEEDAPLEGERISVLELQQALEPDDAALEVQGLITPDAWRNQFWPQTGGYPNHSMQNLALNPSSLNRAWSVSIGQGSSRRLPLTAQPIVADGQVFTLDTDFNLSSFKVLDGALLWRSDVASKSEDDPVIAGGIAYSSGILYVTNGYNELLAVDPKNGEILWRKTLPAPSRAAPTIMEDRVFVTTLDGKLLAMNAADGASLWEYAGIHETASLLGAASPAANRQIVVPAFSSGEITALRVQNGSVAWSDNLSNLRNLGGLASLAAIRALPVIDKGVVIAISFSGRLVAIDERTGTRIWQREISGSKTPWLAGNHLFVISSENELVALGRDTGAIRWIIPLPRYVDNDTAKPISWSGPILAGGRLIAVGTDGIVMSINPEDGAVLGTWDAGGTVTIDPIVADSTLYLLEDNGTLSAYR
jgi:outer membrane protein assembly factor BamB